MINRRLIIIWRMARGLFTFDKRKKEKKEEKREGHNMVVEFLYKEVMSAKVAEKTTKGETHKQQNK